jgi:hypothetical protein
MRTNLNLLSVAKFERSSKGPTLPSPAVCLSLHSGKHSEVKKLLEAGLDWDWSDDDGYAHLLLLQQQKAILLPLQQLGIDVCNLADTLHFWRRVKGAARR